MDFFFVGFFFFSFQSFGPFTVNLTSWWMFLSEYFYADCSQWPFATSSLFRTVTLIPSTGLVFISHSCTYENIHFIFICGLWHRSTSPYIWELICVQTAQTVASTSFGTGELQSKSKWNVMKSHYLLKFLCLCDCFLFCFFVVLLFFFGISQQRL